MLFFRDIYNLNENKTIYFGKPTSSVYQTIKNNFQIDVPMATIMFQYGCQVQFKCNFLRKHDDPPFLFHKMFYVVKKYILPKLKKNVVSLKLHFGFCQKTTLAIFFTWTKCTS